MTRTLKFGLVAAASVAAVALPAAITMSSAAEGAVVPPAALVEPAKGNREVAVLAGGCFWGVEAVYEHVKGVIDVRSGYAGGTSVRPNYESVSSGSTGNAESVRIVFDPAQVSYAELLRILFSVVADPTEVNRQGLSGATQSRACVPAADRDADRIWPVRRGRGLPSGLHGEEPQPSLHPDPRSAEAGGAPPAIPGPVEGVGRRWADRWAGASASHSPDTC
jgi:peptide-methionine (S)-S-oxide reductase